MLTKELVLLVLSYCDDDFHYDDSLTAEENLLKYQKVLIKKSYDSGYSVGYETCCDYY